MAALGLEPPADGVPAQFRLELDGGVRRLDGGRVLLGGVPLRLIRLTPAGAALVDRWSAGCLVGDHPGAAALARRLLATGIAHPRPAGAGAGFGEVAIVVPARDRAEELRRCLAAVGPAGEVVVVDDGSRDPGAIAAVAAGAGARVVRRARPGGPAAARNAGLGATTAPFVAFVDSDCCPETGWLARLLGHLDDPAVGAVAPRVVGLCARSPLGRFDAARSPLDQGPRPGAVAPGRPVSYVPATALVVRRSAAGAGFDETLRFGEDVDFVWRLARAGWTIRYEPAARVAHPHRRTLDAWLAQRLLYGSSAAALARRHPGRLAHLELPAWAAAPWVMAAAGRPRAAAGAALAGCALLAHRLDGVPGRGMCAVTLTARAHGQAARQLAAAVWRAYSPIVLPLALRSPRVRRLLALATVAPALVEWRGRRPAMGLVQFTVLRVAEDAAYAGGVWLGCLRQRTAAPLVPRVTGLGGFAAAGSAG